MTKNKKREGSTERDLQEKLRRNIKLLEPTLKIIDGGRERMVEYGGESNPGRIDITAQDGSGATVVIELKIGKAGRRAIGQILGYMGVTMRRNGRVRGILVAEKFSPQGRSAARVVPNLSLRKISDLF